MLIFDAIYESIEFAEERTMPLTYTDVQRRAYLTLTDTVGLHWVEMFEGDTEFYSAAYWDLLTALWRTDKPVRKTDAARMLTGVKSPLTAAKHIDTALARGLIVERDNPTDARSKLLALTPQMRSQLDQFFDDAVDAVLKTADRVRKSEN